MTDTSNADDSQHKAEGPWHTLSWALWPQGRPKRAAKRREAGSTKTINLALQGGGAHGAFTWGVLDALLEDGRLTIDGISGSSAGAVNAVMLADGLARGGPEEARKRLANFWRAASRDGGLTDPQRTVVERLLSFLPFQGFPLQAWGALSRFLSPYDVNPLNINPLKDLISRFVDFDAVRDCSNLQLFISATNVHTGRLRVFSRETIDADVVMASAALPFLFRAVEIGGVPYWDGGYTGNPPIFPLIGGTETEDILVVQISPLERQGTPTSSQEILNRVNEITFNSTLAGELRAIEFVGRLIEEGQLRPGTNSRKIRHIHMHRIVLGGKDGSVPASSRLNTDYDFFEMLRDAGRDAAKRFLAEHFNDIGERSTIDLRSELQAEWA